MRETFAPARVASIGHLHVPGMMHSCRFPARPTELIRVACIRRGPLMGGLEPHALTVFLFPVSETGRSPFGLNGSRQSARLDVKKIRC